MEAREARATRHHAPQRAELRAGADAAVCGGGTSAAVALAFATAAVALVAATAAAALAASAAHIPRRDAIDCVVGQEAVPHLYYRDDTAGSRPGALRTDGALPRRTHHDAMVQPAARGTRVGVLRPRHNALAVVAVPTRRGANLIQPPHGLKADRALLQEPHARL